MAKQETITVNGKNYIEYDPNTTTIQPAVETDHIIVIAQRGWIFEGYRDKAIKDEIVLLNPHVVRRWTNGKGIGGLASKASKDEYTLDVVPTVRLVPDAIIATLDITEW